MENKEMRQKMREALRRIGIASEMLDAIKDTAEEMVEPGYLPLYCKVAKEYQDSAEETFEEVWNAMYED